MKGEETQLKYFDDFKNFGHVYERIRIITKLVREEPKGTLLDVGCGDGSVSARFVGEGWSVSGVELGPKNVEKARKKGIDAVAMNVEEGLPYKRNIFDLVIAGEIIEHLTTPDSFLKECYRVLKPNGILILTTPNICFLWSRVRVLFGKLPYDVFPIHLQHFTLSSLKKLLSENGFITEKEMGDMLFGERILDRMKLPFLKPVSTYPAKFLPSLSSNLIIKARKLNK
jgi:2-polyprenyl-3-methyl-5-hydroxy-6-metoxy-1,4-benzoquinol methylase